MNPARALAVALVATAAFLPTRGWAQDEDEAYEEHLERGRYFLRQAEYDEALAELRIAARTEAGNNLDCLLMLSQAAQRAGEVGIALTAIERAMPMADGDQLYELEDLNEVLSRGYGRVEFVPPGEQAFPSDPVALSTSAGRSRGIDKIVARVGEHGFEDPVEYFPVGEWSGGGLSFTVTPAGIEVQLPESLFTGVGQERAERERQRRARTQRRDQSGADEVHLGVAARGGLQLLSGGADFGNEAPGAGGEIEVGLLLGRLRIALGGSVLSHGISAGADGSETRTDLGVLIGLTLGYELSPAEVFHVVPFGGYGIGPLGRLQYSCRAIGQNDAGADINFSGACLVPVLAHGPQGGVDLLFGSREGLLQGQLHIVAQPLFVSPQVDDSTTLAGDQEFAFASFNDELSDLVLLRLGIQGGVHLRF